MTGHTTQQNKVSKSHKLKNKFQVYYRPKCDRQILKRIEENIDFNVGKNFLKRKHI